jgi:Glycosyltransferase 61
LGAADILAGYAGPDVIPRFRDISDLEELGALAEPHRLRLGTPMPSRPPSPLFNAAALPQRVTVDHAGRPVVPGPEFTAVTGYELGSFGLLQRRGRVFVDDRVQPYGFNQMIQPDKMPSHWVRGLLRPDADIIESDMPVGVALNAHLVWGHFLLEMMARVHLLATLRTLGRPMRIAVPSDAPGWAREFIGLYFSADEMLTYDSERQRVRAPCFVLPSMMMEHYHFHPVLNSVVQQLLDRVLGPGPGLPRPDALRRLYLSRARHDGWHAIANEAEVEATLTDLGFTVLQPQDMPLRSQLALYAGAACIVSQYSSAAHNAIFAPLGTSVFCFGWMNRCQSGIAALRGQPLAFMRPSDCDLIYPPEHREPGVFRFSVDCRELARELPAFLRFAEAARTR